MAVKIQATYSIVRRVVSHKSTLKQQTTNIRIRAKRFDIYSIESGENVPDKTGTLLCEYFMLKVYS